MKVNDIRQQFLKLAETAKPDEMIEIINANFIADEDTIFGEVNADYVRREIAWYESMSLNVNDIEAPIPRIWQEVANGNGEILSNYGWCVFSPDNFSQYEHVLEELRTKPESRRAIMIYSRPRLWLEYNASGISDFMCCTHNHFFIRDNKLISIVSFRSNDAIFGYRNDLQWMKYVHKKLSTDLEVGLGDMHWHAESLHIYPRHHGLVK